MGTNDITILMLRIPRQTDGICLERDALIVNKLKYDLKLQTSDIDNKLKNSTNILNAYQFAIVMHGNRILEAC